MLEKGWFRILWPKEKAMSSRENSKEKSQSRVEVSVSAADLPEGELGKVLKALQDLTKPTGLTTKVDEMKVLITHVQV